MANHPLLSIRNATISFAKKTLFENLNLNLFPKDRVCLIGKNGVGKTTLINAIFGSIDLDVGERWIMPGCVLGYLSQNEDMPKNITALTYIIPKFIFNAAFRQNILSQKLLQKSLLYQDIQQDFCDDLWLKR